MIQGINNKHWIADNGNTFIRKVDKFDMGEVLYIGNGDTIDNYEEKPIESLEE